jgi:hypothetical protein
VLERSTLRPDVVKIARLQQEASRLDSVCARRGEPYCEKARAAKSRYWRLLREWERDKARLVVRLALQHRAAIVVDVPDSESVRRLKEGEKYPAGSAAGKCWSCRCMQCGLEVSRDEVPAAWAQRRFGELPQTARSQRRGPSPRPAGESPGTRRAAGG